MKDNRNRYNEEIEKYQSMDQFQVGIAVFDPGTTETQFYDNVRSVCEMMNNNISISVGVTWAEHGKEFNEKIMEADWRMYEQKMHIINSSRLHNRNCCNKCLKE